MRMASGILLWLLATVVGLVAAAWFSAAGLGWSDGFIKRAYWEELESDIGIAISVFLLLVWLVLLGLSFFVIRGRSLPPSRGPRVTSSTLTWLSIVAVVVACVVSIGWPEPASEYPLPPWGRA